VQVATVTDTNQTTTTGRSVAHDVDLDWLAQHDREVELRGWERRGLADIAAVHRWMGRSKTSDRVAAVIQDVNWRDFDAPAPASKETTDG
jgi:hypothetical protein